MAFGFDLTVLAAGVRTPGDVDDPVAFRDSVGAAPESPLTPAEQDDLAAFARHGWRFGPEFDAQWFRNRRERGSDVEAGVLARRRERGLVIVQNRVVVAFRAGAKPFALSEQYGEWDPLPFGENLFTINLSPPPGDLHEWIEQQIGNLKEAGGRSIEWLEPVFTFHLQAPSPSPPRDGLRLRHLFLMAGAALSRRYDHDGQWQWPLIDLSSAWDHTRGAGTTVAVIDDGFFMTAEIPSNAVLSLKADGSTREQPLPGAYHGTFCAALVGSPLNDRLGNGVAPECTLQLVAVSDVMNSDGFAKALTLCARNGADVITCSLGPNGGTWENLNTLRAAIDDVQRTGRRGKGTVVVWAVGNDEELIRGTDLESYAPLLCVGPSDVNDARGSSGHGDGLDLVAPGIGVRGLVSLDGSRFKIIPQRGGASFAAPVVAGVAALVIAVNPSRTWDQVADIILENCDKRPRRPPSPAFGWGRVNASKAVTAALARP
jgi:subtilisin family serine protease